MINELLIELLVSSLHSMRLLDTARIIKTRSFLVEIPFATQIPG